MGSSDPPEVHQMPASMPAGALGDGFSPPQVSPAAADLSCPAVAADLPASPTDIPPVVTAPNSSFLGPGIGDPDAAGYEGSDDMETMSMGHCTNCTATLWSSVCSDCGHAADEDAHIFNADLVAEDYDVRPMAFPPLPTVLAYDERMLLHEEGPASTHPERPDRVRAVMARLQAAQLAGLCQTIPCREATRPEIEACHVPELAREVDIKSEEARIRGSSVPLKPDTYVNQHTSLCARLSAGACIDVAEAVVHGEARSGAAICRPPGHHAESNTSMGFCFFNNAAIAARAAQRAGASRVLIFDWDVHHGNGTQEIFEDDDSVLYISVHRHDNGRFYPFTGSMSSVGAYGAEGFSVNVGWPCAGMRNGDYLAAMHHVVLPIAYGESWS